jgi:hypothetical protein
MTRKTDERAHALMEIAVDDCPICIAARARTEKQPEPPPEPPRRERGRR